MPEWRNVQPPPALPKDEVRRAITFGGNCRVPQSWRPIPLFFRNEGLYDFFATWPNDVIPLADPEHDPRQMLRLAQEKGLALHGSSAVSHLLDDWSQLIERFDEFFTEPSESWQSVLRSQVAETPELFHSALHIGLLFEPAYWLLGMQRYLVGLYEHLHDVERLLDRLLEWQIKAARAYAAAGADGITTSDDWGTQKSLLIDPGLWRALFKPRYKAYADAAHEAGLLVAFHSDGNLDSVFPDIVEIGFDVFNPLQPGAMDVDRWITEFKGRITFLTGVDVQGMLPFASPTRVRDEVRRSVDKFHHENGGFILGPTNAVTAEVPYENLVALHETLLEYR